MPDTAEPTTFKPRQRVIVLHGAGDEAATIVRPDSDPDWFVVRFADRKTLCVHASGIKAAA